MRAKTLWMFLLWLPVAASAEVYKWTDAQGRVHFSDKRGHKNAEVVKVRVNSYQHVSYSTVFPSAKATADSRQVILYGTEWCGHCKNARRYFQEKGIAYRDLDIEKDAAAKRDFEAMDGRGVPVILVGNQRMNGFSPAGFQRLYE